MTVAGRVVEPARRFLAALLVRHADRANRAGDWTKAERLYGWALTLRPNLAPILVQYGHALKQQGFPHRAARAYAKAAGRAGGAVGGDAALHLGHLLGLLERPFEAAEAFAAALGHNPHSIALRNAYERALAARRSDPPLVQGMLAMLLEAHDLPPSVLARLDAGFYRQGEPDLALADLSGVVEHFGRVGLARLKPLNAHDRFDAGFYRATYPPARRLSAARAYRHWLTLGLTVGYAPNPDAARDKARQDASDEARRGAAMLHAAEDTPSSVVPEGRQWSGPDYQAVAAARVELESWEGALAVLAEGVRMMPADADLRGELDEVADRAIRGAWEDAERRAAAGEPIDVAREALVRTIRAAVQAMPTAPPLPRRAIASVAIVGNADLPQCRFYRIDGKLEHLAEAGFEAVFFDETADIPRFLATMGRFQAVIFYRVPAHVRVINAILAARALGLVTIYEIDDLLFDAEHYPAPLDSYGGEFSPTEHRGLALGVPMFAEAMALCDYGLASTDVLAQAMRPHVRTHEVFVCPNAYAAAHEAFAALSLPVRVQGRVTVFYGSHTKAHKADVEALVGPALAALVARHGAAVSLLFVGFVPMTPTLQALGAPVTILDPMPLAAYWALLQSADIVVAPLFRSPATDAKSEIKWLEAAMLGLPAVVSRTATAEAVIEDGVTGFLCETTAEWSATLERLVADEGLRRSVGAKAKAEALRRYAPEQAAASLRVLMTALSPRVPVRVKPKLVIVNVFYPPQDFGGATRVVRDNVRDLLARHGDVFDVEVFATVASAGEPHAMRSFPVEGVRVTTVTAPAGSDERDMVATDPLMGAAFASFLDAVRPDLVHFHCVQRLTASVVDVALRRAIPYLITAHDGWWVSSLQFLVDENGAVQRYDYGDPLDTLGRLGRPAFDRLLTLSPLLTGARAVLAVSDPFAAQLAASGVPKVMAVPNGVSPRLCAPRVTRDAGPVRLGYLGGLSLRKGWPLIAQALHGLDAPLSLLVVDHALVPWEIRQEQWGTIAVTFRGPCPSEAVAKLYADIDVLLAPSLWPESFGLVTREALAAGCWVIASDRGAIAGDVVNGVNGYVVDVAGPAGLRVALERVGADPGRFRQPPPRPAPLRMAADQADDLARLYREILGVARA